jgi:hypothetical protein
MNDARFDQPNEQVWTCSDQRNQAWRLGVK